jgi:dipeptidyl aminopeptidase/acylaminoacyl peptidase
MTWPLRSLVKYSSRIVIALLCSIASRASSQAALEGKWEGQWTRDGASLAVRFDLQRSDSTYTGQFGSSQLRVVGIPLSKISLAASRVHFELVGDRTTMVFDGELAGRNERLSGTFRDGDARGTFDLHKTTSSSKLTYREEQVTFANGEVILSGSLLLPNGGKARYPAIVFLHGSGPEGRYASRFLADLFASRGIATLIYDKRGVGSSKGDWRTADYQTLAQDAIAAVAMLRGRNDIDSSRIGIYGHSQGASIAPLVASRAKVAFAVASAASGIRADEGERYSLRNSLGGGTLTPAESARAERFIDALIRSGRQGARSAELDSIVARDSTAKWFFRVPPNDNYYWSFSKAIATYDPAHYWANVHVPVLFLYGANDQRVSVKESMTRIRAALRKAHNDRYTIKVFPNADHTLRLVASPGGAFQWPRNPPGYLETLVDWVIRVATK